MLRGLLNGGGTFLGRKNLGEMGSRSSVLFLPMGKKGVFRMSIGK